MQKNFGKTPAGAEAHLYTISRDGLTAQITDFGATLVKLWVPDRMGNLADVVLGFDKAEDYATDPACFGGTIGRNANRIGGASFQLGGSRVELAANDNNKNNLHSGPDGFHLRLWKVVSHQVDSITFALHSPHGDQGFPGNADIQVTYALEYPATMKITYRAVCDRDTVFNMTNHSYFNLAGHDKPELALSQTLMMPARHFTVEDAENIPTGEKRSVVGTPMDFREPKAVGRDIGADYEPLQLQNGYDHNYEVFCAPCAILRDPDTDRSLAITTDCPGIQLYSGNFVDAVGKDGVVYGRYSGIALETQFYPDAVNKPDWIQPVTKAGEVYKSVTVYQFQ